MCTQLTCTILDNVCEINKHALYNLNTEYEITGVVLKTLLIINSYEAVYTFWRKLQFYGINKIHPDACIGQSYNWTLYSLQM